MPNSSVIVYVGSVLPAAAKFHDPAFSPAGNLFQLNLLRGLVDGGVRLRAVLTQRPMRSFPRSSTLWCPPGREDLGDGLPATHLPFLNLPLLRPISVGMMVVAGVWRAARRVERGHLIVCTYNLSEPPGLFSLMAARLVGAKAVALIYDVHVPGALVPASWSRRLDFLLQRWLMPRFDGLVVVTSSIARDFAPRVPHIRVDGGVSESMLEVGRRRKRRSEEGPFTMVSAGGLHPGNGIEEMLGAMRLLPGPAYRLRIAGAGPLEQQVRAAQARDPRIEYCGLLSFEQVLDLYASADVLLNVRVTKRLDTRYYFPSKTMEYLASSVPVITTCPGNVREDFTGLAYFLEDESPAGLARLIAEVAALPQQQREATGRAAWEFVATHRTWPVQARRIADFLGTLFSGKL
jgi:glycosyltransferase involved in cell wall biosynthesis